jgi:hypothetical protein
MTVTADITEIIADLNELVTDMSEYKMSYTTSLAIRNCKKALYRMQADMSTA